MNVARKSLNNEFQIQVCWKKKDSSFLSWSFDLKRKMVSAIQDPRTLWMFYITYQCQKAQAKGEYECNTKEFE